ncbi:MAG: NADH-quinone oxidoreductase subunit A [Planctomycetes bacterium]|nr:NADH-quinone oxidoreductase subunit A [Planctomycetota bacterium]
MTPAQYIPLLIFIVIVFVFGFGMLGVSHLVGPRKRTKQKFEPYECGKDQGEEPRKRFGIKFYLIATLFILFDIETVFLLPWAVSFKSASESMGLFVAFEMLVFMAILVVGYVYIWKKGAFNWD